VASDVSPEHVTMLLEIKPEVISFHFASRTRDCSNHQIRGDLYHLQRDDGGRGSNAGATRRRRIIAQGIEARGHRATFSGVDVGIQPGLFELLPQVVYAVGIPVIAAGGVAALAGKDGRRHRPQIRRQADRPGDFAQRVKRFERPPYRATTARQA
jgi:nitronate monooxygenase